MSDPSRPYRLLTRSPSGTQHRAPPREELCISGTKLLREMVILVNVAGAWKSIPPSSRSVMTVQAFVLRCLTQRCRPLATVLQTASGSQHVARDRRAAHPPYADCRVDGRLS